jgi:hydroxymethylglutaryl-CoA lyase
MAGVSHVIVRDVSLRDGLQDEAPISTEAKRQIFDALVDAGVRQLELTSFVRPDRVPAMADAAEFVAVTSADARAQGVRRFGLALNQRGAERAVANGITDLQFVLSVSERHNRGNAGRTVDESFAELAAIVVQFPDANLEVTLATAFGCPYTGPVDPDAVLRAVDRALIAGVSAIGIADTIGVAVPSEVRGITARAVAAAGVIPVGAHLHDTRGLALANAFAALEAGATRIDASLGGLGGCPFAPGASGNLPIEDLVHALEAEGIETGIDLVRLIEAARIACDSVGRPVASHVGQAGPRFAGTPRP